MKLIYTELNTEAYQEITMVDDCNLVYVRPHVIKYGSPSGSLKVQILDSNGYLIGESATVAISTISLETYAHGYLRFALDVPLKSGLTYRINLVGTGGYSYADANHIGFCRDFDLRKVVASYTPNLGLNSAYDIELWERTVSDRVVEFFDGFESASDPTAQDSTEFTLANNQASAADVTGLVFNNTEYQDAIIWYSLWRGDDTEERKEQGVLRATYHPDAGTWTLSRETDFDTDGGVTFTVTGAGQIQYVTDNMAGGNYEGYMRFQVMKQFEPKS